MFSKLSLCISSFSTRFITKTMPECISEDWENIQQEEVTLATTGIQLIELAQEAVRAGLIPQDMLDIFVSFDPQIPISMRKRYLFSQIHDTLKSKEGLFMSMVQMFLKHRPEPGTKVLASNSASQGHLAKLAATVTDEEFEDELTPDYIPDLTELLVRRSYAWRPLGIALRFQSHELDNIEACPGLLSNAPQSYLV